MFSPYFLHGIAKIAEISIAVIDHVASMKVNPDGLNNQNQYWRRS